MVYRKRMTYFVSKFSLRICLKNGSFHKLRNVQFQVVTKNLNRVHRLSNIIVYAMPNILFGVTTVIAAFRLNLMIASTSTAKASIQTLKFRRIGENIWYGIRIFPFLLFIFCFSIGRSSRKMSFVFLKITFSSFDFSPNSSATSATKYFPHYVIKSNT